MGLFFLGIQGLRVTVEVTHPLLVGQNEKWEWELLTKFPTLSAFWLHEKSSIFGASLCDLTDLATAIASTFFFQLFLQL